MMRCLNCMNEYQEAYKHCPGCGYANGSGDCLKGSLPEGSILQNRYIVGRLRTHEEMALSYIGWDAMFERKVLIREFFPSHYADRDSSLQIQVYPSKREDYEKECLRFTEGGRELLRLYREPDIITVYSCFLENDTAYLITEYEDWETISDWVGEGGALTTKEALDIFRNLIQAVKKVHALSLIHGNIEAKHVCLFEDRSVVLKDFFSSSEECFLKSESWTDCEAVWMDIRGIARLFCYMTGGEGTLSYRMLEQNLVGKRLAGDKGFMKAMRLTLSAVPKEEIKNLEDFEQSVFHDRASMNMKHKKPSSVQKQKAIAIRGMLLVAMLCLISTFMALGFWKKGSDSSAEKATPPTATKTTIEVETTEVETTEVETTEVTTTEVETTEVETRKVETSEAETTEVETRKVETSEVERKPQETRKKEAPQRESKAPALQPTIPKPKLPESEQAVLPSQTQPQMTDVVITPLEETEEIIIEKGPGIQEQSPEIKNGQT